MTRSLALGSLFCGIVLLTSCSSGIASDPGSSNVPPQSSASVVEAPPSSTTPEAPVPTPPPTVDASVTGVQKMQVTFVDGYIANVTLSWHKVDLVDQVALGCGAPSGANVITKAVVAKGMIDYPAVNGFAPPAALQLMLSSNEINSFGTQLECSSAGYGPASYHQVMKLPTASDAASGNGTFNLVLGDVSVRTPNQPDGEFAGTYKNVEMRFSGAAKCTFEGPGVKADETFPNVCVVSVPK